jgi:acyl carrier protein
VVNEDDAVDALCKLVAEAVNTNAAALTDDSSTETIANWDSSAGMALMVLLEETYGVIFDAEEIGKLRSVGAIRRMLREKGVAL